MSDTALGDQKGNSIILRSHVDAPITSFPFLLTKWIARITGVLHALYRCRRHRQGECL